MDLADRIAAWALAYEVTPSIRAAVRASVLDFAACARLGLGRAEIRPFRQLAASGSVPLWRGEAHCDSAGAALLHGIAGSLAQLHDVHADIGLHASSAVVPAAWSAWSTGSGHAAGAVALISAVAAGYETAYQLALACVPGQPRAGGSASGTAGAIGAAVAAARIMGHDRRQLASAIGNASLMLAATPTMPMRAHASAAPLHGGIAARCGYEAALLAREVGAGQCVLEGDGTGPGLMALLHGDAGRIVPEDWRGQAFDSLCWKLAPGCIAALPAVEAARALRSRIPPRIDAVDLQLQSRLIELIGTGPHGDELYDRLMSVRWLVARALTAPTDEVYAALDADFAAAALVPRIGIHVSAALDALRPDTIAVDLSVHGAGRCEVVQHRRAARSADLAGPGDAFTFRHDDPALRLKRQRLASVGAAGNDGWSALCGLLGEPVC